MSETNLTAVWLVESSIFKSVPIKFKYHIQTGFAESLQQEYAQIVVIELYCCGPDLATTTLPLLPNKERSWVFRLQALLQRFCKTLSQQMQWKGSSDKGHSEEDKPLDKGTI